MTVKILLFFTLYLMSVSGGASREVTGYPGGGALIKCKYERSYTSNKKYFCKSSWTNCADQISTGVSNEWKNIGRFSLFDNTSAAEFWVLIRELTVEDSGTYQCGVDIEWNKDLYTPVELKIKEDQDHEKSITVNGDVGGNVNISCKYPRSSSNKPRFLCRRVGSDDCNYKASVNESRRWIKEGKFSLYDDQAQQTFTVSINNLTNKDSGEYWCGAESDWESDHGYKVYIRKIKLTVTAPVKMTTLNIMPTSPKENDGIYQEIDKQQQGPAMKSPFTTISSPAEGPNDAPIYSTIDEPTELTLYCTTTLP